MDPDELKRLLEQVDAEKTVVQGQIAELHGRRTALAKTADGIRGILGLPPEPGTRPAAGSRAPGTPNGAEAARLVLESDTSRFWTVRDVHDEQVRRGWAAPRPRGAAGNPPCRMALMRLHEQYPESVQRTDSPFLAFKWTEGEQQ